ncbi:hypothetical protein [Kribbella sp. NBC_00889]|uniref:hypothetical protein n=1 Tax=Kribbella sp. NBC_00889 TaxID=2975974 RepID=UPI00386DEE60|nr:hypothetical protein OG817_26860 [Kribbella sp. NBC_00889]
MTTPNGNPGRESWWTRLGTLGQTLTALIGLLAALIPILAKTGLPGQDGDVTKADAIVTTAPYVPPPTSPPTSPNTPPTRTTTPPEQPDPINLTVSDQLTEGALEEVIVISLEGTRVATLHATSAQPVVSRRVTATKPGNYSYVVDAAMTVYDEIGDVQVIEATGRGSVMIDEGTRLDVYVHQETNGLSLSLQSAAP